MIDSHIPQRVVRGVLEPLRVTTATEVPPGFSGAVVFRCQRAAGGDVALKRWPGQTTQARVEEVHHVMKFAKDNGCDSVPGLCPLMANSQTLFVDGSGLWEAQQWMAGQASKVLPDDLEETLSRVEKGATAISQFHASVRDLGITFQTAPAVHSRFKRLGELNLRLPRLTASFLASTTNAASDDIHAELSSALSDACRLVQWKWNTVSPQMVHSLGKCAEREVRTQYVLRDIHREHAFFLGERSLDRESGDQEPSTLKISALIDFDAIRIDTPLTDLARWAGSWMADCDEPALVWQAASAGFFQDSPFNSRSNTASQARFKESTSESGGQLDFTDEQLDFAKQLAMATNWISLGNWLIWLIDEKRTFPGGPIAIATRIRELIRSSTRVF